MTAGPHRPLALRAVFVDANPALAAVADTILHLDGVDFRVHRDPDVRPDALPAVIGDAAIALVDHTALPLAVARACANLAHVVFLGTGARSYMDPEALAAHGVAVHTIRGYGDTAVAECAIALMFAAARGIAAMDRAMRAGAWQRTEGLQLTGRRLGLVGFGGIAREVARLALGIGMEVVAYNRTPRSHPHVKAASLVDALRSGHLGHAGLDVYAIEPLPASHPFLTLPNVTLSAHSGFRTAEANRNLIGAALEHCRRIAAAA